MKKLGVVYTSYDIARQMCQMVLSFYNKGELVSVCDPCCGEGIFIQAFLDVAKERGVIVSDFVAYDIDADVIKHCKEKFSNVTFLIQDFLFSEMNGFDIVIGNPPYIQIQKFARTKYQDDLESQHYATFERTGDIYALFYEKGIKILKKHGHLAFITSNKWMRAKYGESLREFLGEKTNPKVLIDFCGEKVFAAATVDVNILITEKAKNAKKTIACTVNQDFNKADIPGFVSKYGTQSGSFASKESWIILSNIEQRILDKIKKKGVPLKKWDIKINYGIKTGYNEAFIIDGKTKDALIRQDPKSAEIIKPILRGKDIKRYTVNFADKWLIATFPAKHININQYPAVKAYLLSFGKKLHQISETYIDDDGKKQKTRKKTGNKWFETQDQIGYYEEFEKEKIVYPQTTLGSYFYYDVNSYYVNDTGFIAIGNSLKYIMSILSSQFMFYSYKKHFSSVELGRKGYQYNKHALVKLPIPQIPKSQQLPFERLVDIILSKKEKGHDTTAEERKIDQLVYQLYGLTDEEIAVVEGKR